MFDDIDLQILHILQEKARIPNAEVARQVGMAPSAVLERIRKLEERGIIEGYEVRLNPKRFNRSLVAFFFVGKACDADDTELGRALADIPEVQEVHYVAGEDSFLVKVRAADTGALERFRRSHLAALEGARTVRTMIVLASYKETARIPIGGPDAGQI